MMVWAEFVDLIYGALVCVSTALGGSMGWAIAVVSLLVRLALLPLTLRVAYRGLESRALLKRLEPQLVRVRAKYAKDQRKVLEETARLYRENGVQLADGRSLLSTAVQLPIFIGLFGAIRRGLGQGGCFLWVRDIASADLPLAGICAGVTALSTFLAPDLPSSQRVPMVILSATLTLFFLARMAAGLSIYTLAQGLVGLGQAAMVRRRARQIRLA
jgi:YidC/Oxa1 family membrane protein insertase